MAHLDTTRRFTALPGAATATGFSRLIARLRSWNEDRVTRKALSRLTDHELNDIGLTRSDIHRF